MERRKGFDRLGSTVLPKRNKIIFLDQNPERPLQPAQFIFIQAVSLELTSIHTSTIIP